MFRSCPSYQTLACDMSGMNPGYILGPAWFMFHLSSPTQPTPATVASFLLLLFGCFSRIRFCDPMDCSLPGSLSIEFSRQEYWRGLPFPSPGDLPDSGIEPMSPALDSSPLSHRGSPVASLLLLKYAKHSPASGPLHKKQRVGEERRPSGSRADAWRVHRGVRGGPRRQCHRKCFMCDKCMLGIYWPVVSTSPVWTCNSS